MITRTIFCYDKQTSFYIRDIPINIEFNILKDIFPPRECDPLLYECYEIKNKEIDKLNKYINIDFDLKKYDYYLEAYTGKE